MAEFYAMGNTDPELEKVYNKLKDRADKLLHAIQSYNRSKDVPLYQKLVSDTQGNYTLDLEELHSKLEDFVIDLTMLELESDETVKASKRKEIFERQHNYRKVYFAQIFLTSSLDSDDAQTLEEIILSSSIDSVDAQLIITAIMLSCIDIFDGNKADILYNVYKKSDNEILRQKAIVSYVLSLGQKSHTYDIKKNPIQPSLLAQIQQQILYTIDSPRVEKIMQNDIMPDIIKNSEFDFQNNRIIQKKKDSIDDILNPHKDEEMIEKMEETMKKMKQLQEQGSDLFFSGFRYVKRHQFFSTAINWFCPFYFDHPQLPVFENADDKNIISKLINRTPFCDSDKYSFVISMKNAIGTIPPEMKQMLKSGEAQLDIVGAGDVVHNEVFIRRTYLQDVYRFYKISHLSKSLFSFIDKPYLGLVIGPFLSEEVEEYDETGISVMKSLRKFDNKAQFKQFVSDWHPYTTEGKIFKAFNIISTSPFDAEEMFLDILSEDPHNVQALFGLTKVCFENFDSVVFEPYEDDTIKSMLALYFKNENDFSVQHNLVKAYLLSSKNDKAMKYVSALIENGKAESFEFTFAGIYKLYQGKVKEAISLLKKTDDRLSEVSDKAEYYGMPIPPIQMDLICNIIGDKGLYNY